MIITEEQVLAALSHVEDPDLKKDLVTLNMIKDVKIEDRKVGFTLELTTPACPMKEMLKNACINAVKHFVAADAEININITYRVTKPLDTTQLNAYGIKLLSLGFFADPDQPVPWRGPMASNAIKQLFNDADWGELDYLIVDLPPGTGDIHITISQSFPIAGAVIVTTPQQVALADTKKGLMMFRMPGVTIPVLGVIENMSYFTPVELPENKYYIFGKDGGKELAAKYDVPFLGEIPLVQSIATAGDNGEPIAMDKKSPLALAFKEIAGKIAQQISINNVK